MVYAKGGAGVGGGIGSTPDGGAGFATLYVEVESIESALQQVEKLGGKAVLPETAIPGMNLTFAYFTGTYRRVSAGALAGMPPCIVK
jgi:predicted enzyme related to lactoylglutathione lyase